MGELTYRVNCDTVLAICNLVILDLKLNAVMTSMICGMDERAMLGA
jgi:hypothetical protein